MNTQETYEATLAGLEDSRWQHMRIIADAAGDAGGARAGGGLALAGGQPHVAGVALGRQARRSVHLDTCRGLRRQASCRPVAKGQRRHGQPAGESVRRANPECP
jgi:hypothetical protein